MSIDQNVLLKLSRQYWGEEIIKGYDHFIRLYKTKHFNELCNTLNKEEWFKQRDNVMERYIKRYYVRS